MDQRREVTDFLRTRRDRIAPEEVGLVRGGRRRVPGLRREEVALLAGVSVEYYARMERGDLGGVSEEVMDSLARALRLDEAEYDHLMDLARTAGSSRRRPRPTAPAQDVTELQRFLDTVTGAPMWARDHRLDFVAANDLGSALYSPILEDVVHQKNTARFMFLSPAARNFYPEWERNADHVVATLRTYAGQNPLDKKLTDLIGELVTRSDDFRFRWSQHHVDHHRHGSKRVRHPLVGDLEFSYEAMELPSHPGWTIFAHLPAVGSGTEEKMKILGSLAATSRGEKESLQG